MWCRIFFRHLLQFIFRTVVIFFCCFPFFFFSLDFFFFLLSAVKQSVWETCTQFNWSTWRKKKWKFSQYINSSTMMMFECLVRGLILTIKQGLLFCDALTRTIRSHERESVYMKNCDLVGRVLDSLCAILSLSLPCLWVLANIFNLFQIIPNDSQKTGSLPVARQKSRLANITKNTFQCYVLFLLCVLCVCCE